jgi:hypothetical protein
MSTVKIVKNWVAQKLPSEKNEKAPKSRLRVKDNDPAPRKRQECRFYGRDAQPRSHKKGPR